MNEIQFTTTEIEHFLAIEQGKIDLENRGLVLIQGENEDDTSANSNGAGKSSIVDAVSWALFGETARGVSGDAVVNREVGKGTRVQVNFTEGGERYSVVRFRKHPKGKNRLHLFKGDDELTLGTDRQTQDLIVKILGCTHDVFNASIYAGQERMPDLPGMTDKALKQIVEEAAGITLLEKAHEVATQDASALRKQADAASYEVEKAKSQVENIGLELQHATAQVADWNATQKGRIQAQKEHVQEILKRAQMAKAEVDAIDAGALEDGVKEARAALDNFGRSLPVAPTPPKLPTAPQTPAAIEELNGKIRKIAQAKTTTATELRMVNKRVAELNHDLEHLEHKVGQACGECGKHYAEGDLVDAKAATLRKLAELQTQQRELAAKHTQVEQLEAKVQAELEDAKRAHTEACEQVNKEASRLRCEYENAVGEHRAAVAKHSNKTFVDALESAQNALQAFNQKRAALDALIAEARRERDRLAQIEVEANPHEASVKRLAERQDDAVKKHAEVEGRSRDIMARSNDAEAVVKLYSPKGIRGEILDTVTPFLNDRTAYYLGELSDGNITATWSTIGETTKGEMREKFHIKVDHKIGAEEFGGLSGGEKRKVRIATAMALQDLVAGRADKPIKLFIADEVDDALDVSGLERLMGVLEAKAKQVGTVLIISHNELGDWVRTQLTVKKSGKVSRIV